MTKHGEISAFQLFCILFVSRMAALFTFIAPRETQTGSGGRILFTVPFFFFCLLSAVPVFLATDGGKRDIFAAAEEASPLLAKGLGIYYPAVFLWTAAVSTARFELFISTVMFPESGTGLLTVMLLAGAAAAASRGQEAVGRMAVILFFLLGGTLLFILLSTAGEADILNLTRPLADGLSPILGNAFHSAARTAEIVSVAAASGFTNGKTAKSTVRGLAVFSLTAAVLFFFIGSVTGLYGEQQMFQLYTLTALAKWGIFERADALLTGVWVLCAFLKAAYFMTLAVYSMRRGLRIRRGSGFYFLSAAVVYAVFRRISGTTAELAAVISGPLPEILFLSGAVVLPLTVFCAGRIKNRQKKKNGTEAVL